jgi:anti-sigma B factor antagonist
MDIETLTVENTKVVRLKGRLDATNAPDLERELTPIIEGTEGTLLINMKDLDYISSAGLRTLLLGAKLLKNKGGALALCALQEAVREVFDIAGFTELFPIYESEEAGLKEIASS